MPEPNDLHPVTPEVIDAQDVPDDETGITPRQLADMGWPMTGEPVEDNVEPKPA